VFRGVPAEARLPPSAATRERRWLDGPVGQPCPAGGRLAGHRPAVASRGSSAHLAANESAAERGGAARGHVGHMCGAGSAHVGRKGAGLPRGRDLVRCGWLADSRLPPRDHAYLVSNGSCSVC